MVVTGAPGREAVGIWGGTLRHIGTAVFAHVSPGGVLFYAPVLSSFLRIFFPAQLRPKKLGRKERYKKRRGSETPASKQIPPRTAARWQMADASDGSLVLRERFDLRTAIDTRARNSVILPARLLKMVEANENPNRMNAFGQAMPDKTEETYRRGAIVPRRQRVLPRPNALIP